MGQSTLVDMLTNIRRQPDVIDVPVAVSEMGVL
jgi:hypothetical protein